jgi:hypothetical protein
MSDANAALGRHLMAVQAPPAGRYLLGLAVMLLGVVRACKPYNSTLVSNEREQTGRVAGMNEGDTRYPAPGERRGDMPMS